MIARDELRALIDPWRAPARKGRAPSKKSKDGAQRLEAAHRLANAAAGADAADVVDALGRASEEFPADRTVRLAYARALAHAGRVGEAIAEFEERLAKHPQDVDDLTDVAVLYEETSRVDLAVDRLRRAVDAFVASGDLDGAVKASRRLIVLEPKSLENAADLVALLRAHDSDALVEGLGHLADVYRERGKLGQEADVCRELLALRPGRIDVRARLSTLYSRILEVDPDDSDAWSGLSAIDEHAAARMRAAFGRDAVPAVLAAPSRNGHARTDDKADPRKSYASKKAAELLAAGDVVGASLCFERLLRTTPDAATHLQLGECYQALHRDQQAAREGLRSLAFAHTADDVEGCEAALAWLTAILPEAGDSLTMALILNQRPASADTLYEELVELWDETAGAASGSGASSD